MLLFKKKQEQGRRRGPAVSPERLVTVRVEVPGHVGREYVLPASLLGHQRLAPLMAEAEAEYGVQQGDVIRVPCRPCHFVDAMVWAAVEEAMQGGTAHGAAVVPVADSGKDSGNRHDLGWHLARPH